jgi:hypothetical protein
MLLTIALAAALLGWGIDHLEQRKQVHALESHFELSFSDDERAALQYFGDARCPIVMRAFHASTLGDEDLKWASMFRTLDYLFVESASDDGLANVARLKNLRILTVVESPTIGDRGVEHLGEMTKLVSLRLGDTQITDKGMESIGRLKQLEILDVSGTRISSDGVRHLSDLRSLRALMLMDNQKIDDRSLEYVGSLPELVSLSIHNTSVTDDGLKHLAHLYALESLSLGNDNIDGSGLTYLRNVKGLKTLYLGNTGVGDDDLDVLKSFPELSSLYINGTKITPAGVEELRAALPNCFIGY